MTIEGLNEDFRDIITAFADHGVEFVVVGAYALAFHGALRARGDIDLLVRPSPENAPRVVNALHDFGAPLLAHSISEADFARASAETNRHSDGNFWSDLRGGWASRVPVEAESRRIHIIGRDAFVKNKSASGRPKDLADVARLKKLQAP
jgi:hypothetical protein